MGEEQGLSGEKPAWQVINDLFQRYGLAPPPVRLRDELVMHYIAARSEGALVPADWLPTAASINALPEPLRRYIHDIETACCCQPEIVQENLALRFPGPRGRGHGRGAARRRRPWSALLAAGPRMVGSAGLEHFDDGSVRLREPDGYIHAGVEFWTSATAQYFTIERTNRGRAVLTAIADKIIEQGGKPGLLHD